MKTVLQQYGLLILTGIIVMIILGYVFSASGFTGQIASIKPEAKVTSHSESGTLHTISSRANPTLEVTTKKLKVGQTYDFIGSGDFNVVSHNADGTDLPVTITKGVFTSLDGTSKTDIDLSAVNLSAYKIEKVGTYEFTYYIEESFNGMKKCTTKTYAFVASKR